jgi:pimeloyl-ACP methyl ester carboxylesterase
LLILGPFFFSASNLNGELRPDIPVMFIRGIRDPTSPAIAAQRMEQLVPRMKKISVDAGHWLMIETKKPVTDGVLRWLGEINLKAKL